MSEWWPRQHRHVYKLNDKNNSGFENWIQFKKKKDIDENLNWSEDKTQILKTSIPKEETQGSTFEVEEIKEKMGYQNGKAKWRY